MSWNPAIEPGCPENKSQDALEIRVIPCSRDLVASMRGVHYRCRSGRWSVSSSSDAGTEPLVPVDVMDRLCSLSARSTQPAALKFEIRGVD